MISLTFVVFLSCMLSLDAFFISGKFGLRTQFDLSMKATIKGGSIVALSTPMTITNAIDYPKLVDLLKWHVSEGSDGVVILGTTGESSTISQDDRTKIIETSVKTVNGAFPVIVGTGTIDTTKVIESSKHAESLGADGVLVITPYYVKPPQRALVTHFNAVADAIKIPVILYNCPGRTGVNMAPETVALCAKHPNIIGLKDAVGNIIERLPQIRAGCGDKFLLYRYKTKLSIFSVHAYELIYTYKYEYSGEDDLGCEYVGLGADGVISVTANVAPNKMHK